MNISVELIPRSADDFRRQCLELRSRFPRIATINVPDLRRFSLRSWEACRLAREFFARRIPHLRAVDFDVNRLDALEEIVTPCDEVLVVQGDPGTVRRAGGTPADTLTLVAELRRRFPTLKIFVAVDPYRATLREELAYFERKVAAGADGFFTQPFFERGLWQDYLAALQGREGYWGLSPVLTPQSRSYWERVNRVAFPEPFDMTLRANQAFAREVIGEPKGTGGNVYFMPIKVGLSEYLGGILGDSRAQDLVSCRQEGS